MTPETQAALDWCRCAEQDLMRHSDDDASLAACRTAIAALEERESLDKRLWNVSEARRMWEKDMRLAGEACGQRDDEYPLEAVQRVVQERDAIRRQLDEAQAAMPPGARGRGVVGEGTWAVHAERMQEQRDEAQARVRDLEAQLSAITVTPEAAEVLELRRQLGEAAQILIAEIGAPGPESVGTTATRAVQIIKNIRHQYGELEDNIHKLQAQLDGERARVGRLTELTDLLLMQLAHPGRLDGFDCAQVHNFHDYRMPIIGDRYVQRAGQEGDWTPPPPITNFGNGGWPPTHRLPTDSGEEGSE